MSCSIAMWSGPRNVSTAFMRSFENRSDCFVSDEPFYSYFLNETDLDHPLKDEIIKSGIIDYSQIIEYLTGPIPHSEKVWYQKHMAHHILPNDDISWIKSLNNCLLIRHPNEVMLSYLKKNEIDTVEQLGYVQQINIYNMLVHDLGTPPIVIDARNLLEKPEEMLIKICKNFQIDFNKKMLSWPSGPRGTDGIWGQHWYKQVESSTGFKPYIKNNEVIPSKYQTVYSECMKHYDFLYQNRIILD